MKDFFSTFLKVFLVLVILVVVVIGIDPIEGKNRKLDKLSYKEAEFILENLKPATPQIRLFSDVDGTKYACFTPKSKYERRKLVLEEKVYGLRHPYIEKTHQCDDQGIDWEGNIVCYTCIK